MKEYTEFISEIRELAKSKDISGLLQQAENAEDKRLCLFAAVCKAAEKGLGQVPFDEQLMAAKALTEGKIIEMPTGERPLRRYLPQYGTNTRGERPISSPLTIILQIVTGSG